VGHVRIILMGCIALVAVVALAGPAGAQDGQVIRGTMEEIDGQDRTPVEGVVVTVEQDGVEIGTAASDAAGDFEVPVPEAGVYQVRIDPETLPEGVALTDPDRTELSEVDVRAGQQKTVRFPLGPGVVVDVSRYERIGELVILGLKLGAIIALSAIGLSLIFGVTGLVNFAHGELLTLGAVLAYLFNVSPIGPEWNLILAAVPAVLLVAAFGGFQERFLWRILRRRHAGNIAMLVISIGLSFALMNSILVVFSGEPRSYRNYTVQDSIEVLGISTVPKNIFIIVSSAAVLVLVGLFLQKTRTGIALRAVADSRDLAESSGIDVNRIILATWVIGAGLAALGGIYLGVSEQIQWNMGFRVLLLIFAAVVLGGLGTAYGAMIGGFVIGLAVEVSTYWIDAELKTAVALAVLIVMLLVRPQGLLGTRERIG
jgi:branched-chain amino acid transport system permease protein